MKKYFLYILLFSTTCTSYAQYREEALLIVDTLTSPYMNGRGYVNNGNKKAAEYISNIFEKNQLSKFGKNYYQEFKMDVNTFPDKITLIINGKTLIAGEDFIVSGNSGEIEGDFSLLQIDSNILHSTEQLKKIYNNAKKDQLLVFYKKDFSTTDYNELPGLFQGTNCLNKAGVIEITEDKLTMDIAMEQMNYAQFVVSASKITGKINSVSATMHPEFLRNYSTQNIIGFVEGKVNKDSFFVFTAHYDHLGQFGDKAYFPGANDNASGIAMLLELVKYYSLPENQPEYSIVFIAFSGEELGLVGSKFYVEHPLFELKKIKFLINMDIMGTGDDGIKVVNGAILTDAFNALVNINTEKNYLKSVQPRGKAANSDHYFFFENGVPCFFIYTLGGIAAYHDVYDKAETLPLIEFDDLFKLLVDFEESFEED
ncbi:MAG: M28 family metallopeptidase [Chitinophagales bacterium]